MKRLRELNAYRQRAVGLRSGHEAGDLGGVFRLPMPGNASVVLNCIASVGEGWDHVSVTLNLPRCPSWAEMEHVKRSFFKPDETAMQLHLPPSDHISVHPYCLHIWRPHSAEIPMPPKEFV